MRPVFKRLIALALCIGACSPPAFAATFMFSGTLSGLNEIPANSSAGTGSFNALLDDSVNSLTVNISFADLASNASTGIIHCCAAADANAPAILTFTGFPGTTSGTYSNTFVGLSLASVAGLKSGLSYINIHTFAMPSGEIRAKMIPAGSPVPEPSTWAMFIGGLGLICGAMRRRQRVNVSFA